MTGQENNKGRGLGAFLLRKLGRWLPDGLFLRLNYRQIFGTFPDLKHPAKFTEVVLWTKLRDRDPLYHKLSDKAEVKDYVASLIGEEYVVRTLGVWNTVEEIDWDILPERFVIKCTHDSGSTIVCKDKSSFDRSKASESLRKALCRRFDRVNREWVYKGITPRIIAEEYLCDDPADYKFFCFDGVPRILFVATDRASEGTDTKFDFFDMEYNHLDVRNGHPNAVVPPPCPETFEKMKSLASVLSKGIPQVRMDFYEVDGKVFFGEYTFCHWGGQIPFDPPSADLMLGSFFRMPVK